jgi:hypothetical protein
MELIVNHEMKNFILMKIKGVLLVIIVQKEMIIIN